MQEAIDQFVANLGRVRNLGALVDALESQTTDVLDLSDILRAELVLSVSALDHYVHEIVRIGMLEAYRGARHKTQQFLNFTVSLESALSSVSGGKHGLTMRSELATDIEVSKRQKTLRPQCASFQRLVCGTEWHKSWVCLRRTLETRCLSLSIEETKSLMKPTWILHHMKNSIRLTKLKSTTLSTS